MVVADLPQKSSRDQPPCLTHWWYPQICVGASADLRKDNHNPCTIGGMRLDDWHRVPASHVGRPERTVSSPAPSKLVCVPQSGRSQLDFLSQSCLRQVQQGHACSWESSIKKALRLSASPTEAITSRDKNVESLNSGSLFVCQKRPS